MSPGGTSFATGHEGGTVLVWDLESLVPIAQLRTQDKGLQHPFFSADGQWIGAGSQATGDVEIWDLASGKRLDRFTFKRGRFRTYHPRAENEWIRPEKDPTRFVFMPDNQSFLAGCFGGIIRSVGTGQELRRFKY